MLCKPLRLFRELAALYPFYWWFVLCLVRGVAAHLIPDTYDVHLF